MTQAPDSAASQSAGGRPAILAEGLKKAFGKIKALDGIDVSVQPGTIMAMLGPNGAGKTTFVRILATLMRPDAGRAEVAGHDVVREAAAVRSLIGLTGQYAAVDENLTGRENLEMVGRLYHIGGARARVRAGELLERFELTDAADRRVKTYSGGMRRRLDLAASLVARPPVLFLDEPTSGLDPRSRMALWDIINSLVKEGTTVLLTTQYLEEADRLADYIAVIDHGHVIEAGTSKYLKECCGGDVLVQVRLTDRTQSAVAGEVLSTFGDGKLQVDEKTGELSLPVVDGTAILPELVRRLDARGITLYDVTLRPPTLDDVFMALTGRPVEEGKTDGTPGEAHQHGRGRKQ